VEQAAGLPPPIALLSLNPFPQDSNRLIAVSGGRDSIVLLHWLLAQGHPNLIVCHLNHSLRGKESDQDAAFVRRLAKKHSLPCEIAKTDVASLAKTRRLSLETAARHARHAFFLQASEKHQTPHLFLAHHAEDQAETVLANACRGTGLPGIAGMKPVQSLDNGLILHRPLLTWRRTDIDAYITTHKLRFREDPSNTSPAHRRNRLRHDILPRLNQALDRDVTPALVRLAAHAARDDDHLTSLTQAWIQSHSPFTPDGRLHITPALKTLHPALLTRLLRLWLQSHSIPNIDQTHIDATLTLLTQLNPAKINLPQNHHLHRKSKHLHLT
jgi:tRNA(Ile)-lysidine synthase